ncbi:ABC transporter ATP-binding protein [[Clostridium] leptum]|nr:ABC transporter ATP-binding protein [[Clostridium] leptum]
MNALELRNVSKSYGDFVLKDISFVLPSGCIMGLIGENGAGKSTTIKLILDCIRRDSGEIFVLGKDNRKDFTAVKEDIGVVLDEAYFPESITVRQVNAVMRYTYRRWNEQTYFSYISRFSLPKDKSFREFSRGMKMKLAIAVALSHEAKLLILDEATSGLDPIARDEILDVFREYTRDEQHSILLSSHITSDLEKLCDYIAFIHKGNLLFCQEKDRLQESYGLLRCSKGEFEALRKQAVLGYRDSGYGIEALVDRREIPAGMKVDYASIEEIIVFLAKGGN